MVLFAVVTASVAWGQMAFDAKTASDPQFTDLLLEGEGGDADGLHSLCKVRALVSLFLNVTHFQVMVGGELVNVEALHNSSPPKSRKKMLHNTTFWSSWPFFISYVTYTPFTCTSSSPWESRSLSRYVVGVRAFLVVHLVDEVLLQEQQQQEEEGSFYYFLHKNRDHQKCVCVRERVLGTGCCCCCFLGWKRETMLGTFFFYRN